MRDRVPPDGPFGSDVPPRIGLFQRSEELLTTIRHLDHDGLAAIWAPRYSGRTTFLHCLKQLLDSRGVKAVYISPDDLAPTNRGSLFQSLSTKIGNSNSYDWDRPDSLQQFLHGLLSRSDAPRLTILLDDCDQLLPGSLVIFLRAVREIQRLRAQDQIWRRVAFVIAGAISFRNLEFLEPAEVSPFEPWPACYLRDLRPPEAQAYFSSAFEALQLHATQEAIETAIDYAGGDLRLLNLMGREILKLSTSTGISIDAALVEDAARGLLAEDVYDSSRAYMLSIITHDPLCLGVVDRLLARFPEEKEVDFATSDLDAEQRERFVISDQELSGGLLLENDENGVPRKWRVRNRFCGELLRRHFTPLRLFRAFMDLGKYERAGAILQDRLASEFAREFRDGTFDETATRDVIEWFGIQAADRPSQEAEETELAALVFLLEKVFGLEQFTLYEHATNPDAPRLVARTLPGRSAPHQQGRSEISLRETGHAPPSREIRAFRRERYFVEGEGGRLKFSIPVKNNAGKVTGILDCHTERTERSWADVRLPIIERAVNTMWQRLSRDPYKVPPGVVTPWISIQFDNPAYGHFQEQISRFPSDLLARFLEFKEGIILHQIIRALKSPDSLLICDTSYANNNVLLELGLAIGLNRPALLVRDEKAKLNLGFLEGLWYQRYPMPLDLGEIFFHQLRKRWGDYQVNRSKQDFVHLLQEDFPPPGNQPLLLVIDHNRYKDSEEFRRALQMASPSGLAVSYLWQGGARDDQLSQETRAESGAGLPAIYKRIQKATAVVARIEKIQEGAEHYALRFVAAGIARGLAEKRGNPRLVLVARQARRRNPTIQLPNDFNGIEIIRFDPQRALDFAEEVSRELARITG